MSEQRQHPRYALEMDSELEVGGKTLIGRTRDISRGGFCFMADEEAPTHQPCRAKLALVFSENQFSEHLSLPGVVVWCTRLAGRYQIGVKFNELDTQLRSYLELFIRFLDGEDVDDDDDER